MNHKELIRAVDNIESATAMSIMGRRMKPRFTENAAKAQVILKAMTVQGMIARVTYAKATEDRKERYSGISSRAVDAYNALWYDTTRPALSDVSMADVDHKISLDEAAMRERLWAEPKREDLWRDSPNMVSAPKYHTDTTGPKPLMTAQDYLDLLNKRW